MPPELASYLASYGYLALFSLIFIQELGVPNPVPNELILLFSGYLASIHTLSFPLVLLSAVAADFIGTSILYLVFYYFGPYILAHKPRWVPLSRERIESIGQTISKKGRWGIYVGRLIPYLRGYASVAAGFLRIPPAVFLTAVIISAMTWSGGYVIAGYFLGPYWQKVAGTMGSIETIILVAAIAVAIILVTRHFSRERQRNKQQ
jgi:membrane protein DedA with SNARE-associated domain